MATDTFHASKPVTDNITYVPCDAGVAIGIGDLIYWDGTYGQPMSAQADGGSEAANQASAAPLFLGVSNSARSGSETTDGEIAVVTDRLFYLPCTSATFVIGDKVTVLESSGGVALEDQKVVKTSDEALAIGYCVKGGTSLTKVWVRMISRVLPNAASSDTSLNLASIVVTGGANIGDATTDLIGFHGATPVDQASAYTQTYATADKTHANPTATALTLTAMGGAADGTLTNVGDTMAGDVSAAIEENFLEVGTAVNAVIVDLADLKQLVNSIIDDLQEKGLVG